MQTSLLQRLKVYVLSVLNVSPDLLLAFLGLVCFLVTCLIARRPLTWIWALAPGLCLAVALEAAEIWDYYGAKGLAKTTVAEGLGILSRHAKDVLVMNLAPLLVLFVARLLDRAPGP